MLNLRRRRFINTIISHISQNYSLFWMFSYCCSSFFTNKLSSSSICISSSKAGCFGMWFSQSELSSNIKFSGSYGSRCLFNFNIIDTSTNPPPNNDLFGVMMSFKIPCLLHHLLDWKGKHEELVTEIPLDDAPPLLSLYSSHLTRHVLCVHPERIYCMCVYLFIQPTLKLEPLQVCGSFVSYGSD